MSGFAGRNIRRKVVSAILAPTLVVLIAWGTLLIFCPPSDPYQCKPASSQVLSRDGRLLRAFLSSDEKWRLRVHLDEVSPHLVTAVLEHEDRWFRFHPGVNPISVVRAAWSNITARRVVSGASTITMQLARLVEPGRRSFKYKFHQAFRALQYECLYSKDEILEAYLNIAPYGGNIEGVGAASYIYFGKPTAELSLAEASLLAILPQSPSGRHPVRHPQAAKEARDRLIACLRERGILDEEAAERSTRRQVPNRLHTMPFVAPHFCEWVVRENPKRERLRTTLDPSIQTKAEALLHCRVKELRPSGIEQGAVVILDYETSELLAMVGSASFHDAKHQGQVNGAVAIRSPGSTLKPLVYALAFDRGYITPASLVEDVPLHFGSYSPANHDGIYRGAMSAAEALKTSRNVPAVALASRLESSGEPGLYQTLKNAGVASLCKPSEHYGLSLVLGGGDLTLLELAGLYATVARQGYYQPVKSILDAGPGRPGAVSAESMGTLVFSRESAYLVMRILTEVIRPELDTVWRSGTSQVPVPWKTGTSYGHRDAWSVGIAGNYVVAVWLGNFGGAGVPLLTGRKVAAPLLFETIDILPHDNPGSWHRFPPSIEYRQVCATSGDPPCEYCPETRWEAYIPGVSPIRTCSVHREIMVDTLTEYTVCSRCKVGERYQKRVVEWWPAHIARYTDVHRLPSDEIPSHNPLCTAYGASEVPTIVSPQEGMEYLLRRGAPLEDQRIALIASASRGCHLIYWFLDGKLIWKGEPGCTGFLTPEPGVHRLTVKDDAGRTATRVFAVVGYQGG